MTLNYVINVGILDLILPTRGDSGLLVKRKVDAKAWNSVQESEAASCACAQSHRLKPAALSGHGIPVGGKQHNQELFSSAV